MTKTSKQLNQDKVDALNEAIDRIWQLRDGALENGETPDDVASRIIGELEDLRDQYKE